ncbi:ABC transporter ATP-binding protein [Planococcus sp. ANT_H30]|uniref:ABC transporter ATP-binding protein n=1 Tax=Planococcus kocurii TaxID=1374 RepID=A0ABM5WSR4_9BACL|nr:MULTISPECIES: ABC transporter ATP-binding protein [Planococcus]ALS77282.1 ABC transporter ATP-binding protein [Planococcus kocurii]KAA0956193.1 ABC transporter ATP-binding protein [Planococcus sp. ANT_H30]
MKAIETNMLNKTYGSTPVVNGISLVVERGEIFGFLGRNGAGKSTFINMLTGITHPTSGSFSLLGVDGPNERIKKHIGVMPDYSTLFNSMSAMKHLKFLSALSGKSVSETECQHVLKLVGLENEGKKKVSKFSFGMKKKLGIAQAIIHNPSLVFLDEPTSGLDAESALHIHKLIGSLKQQGKTVFMTSHNLDEVEKICTTIAIMKDGGIVKSGTMDELRAYYRSAITVQLKHDPIPTGEAQKLYAWLETAGTEIQQTASFTTITVDSEQKIAELIRAFTNCHVNIFRVEVNEPSLEEMFLAE